MNVFLAMIVLFSIVTDFTSASISRIEDPFVSEQFLSCTDIDLHDANGQDHEQDDDLHCHCHSGHFHTVVIYKSKDFPNPIATQNKIKYFTLNASETNGYQADHIRPPIL